MLNVTAEAEEKANHSLFLLLFSFLYNFSVSLQSTTETIHKAGQKLTDSL